MVGRWDVIVFPSESQALKALIKLLRSAYNIMI